MSEQRIPLLIASGGLLCLLLQLVLSMTDSPARRAQLVACLLYTSLPQAVREQDFGIQPR